MKRPLLAIGFLLTLSLPVIFMGALMAFAGEELTPSDKALEEIPADLLPIYMGAASTCDGLDWTILAAIHKIETGFGKGSATSSKGAEGPMQFMPATWDAYGLDADGDGSASVDNVTDAIYSAASLLCANGAGDPARLASAIWNYNHSDAYVAQVLELSTSYGVLSFGHGLITASASDLLSNPRILLTSNARADLEAGVVDPRLLVLLETISRRYSLGVSVFKSGHSMHTRSGSISNHFYGRGVDIFFVDGGPVSSSNTAARRVITFLAGLEGEIRPTEIGHPFTGLVFIGGFSDADHSGHLHIAFDSS